MQLNQRNVILLAVMAFVVFVLITFLLVQVVPGPLKQSDYVVIGAVSTLAALAAVFALVMRVPGMRDILFKRRK